MDRNRTKDYNLVGANDRQSRELTEAELDAVAGGIFVAAEKKANEEYGSVAKNMS
jgi:hypothetical protein